jgi:hypothetical protein
VAGLRRVCLAAVGWLGREVTVLADGQGARVARHLLDAAPRQHDEPSYLVVGNGSAKRTEKAPGHLDERAEGFDAALGAALRAGRPDVDPVLARELWAAVDGIIALRDLAARGLGLEPAEVDLDDAPFGVQYWVMRWDAAPPGSLD